MLESFFDAIPVESMITVSAVSIICCFITLAIALIKAIDYQNNGGHY